METFLLSGVAEALWYAMRLGILLGLLFHRRWDLTLPAIVVAPVFWYAARHFARLVTGSRMCGGPAAGPPRAVTPP